MTHLRSTGFFIAWLTPALLLAQTAPPPASPQPTRPQPTRPVQPGIQPVLPMPAVDPNIVAATVNGVPIREIALQRGLERVPPAKRAEVRPEILHVLIDNLLIDQYLTQGGINPTAQEVEAIVTEGKTELAKENKNLPEMLARLHMNEAEFRQQIAADLRLEKYVNSQATDAALRQVFDANKEMFDKSAVRARHILLTPPETDARAVEAAVTALRTYKQHVQTQAAAAVARLPANADAVTRAKAHAQAVEETFALVARDRSACPSKERGGDLGWFPRVGYMVEPFARAAYALKPGEMSDVVKTPFGYHLILLTDRKPGEAVKFEDARERVKMVFYDRLRDNLIAQLRPKAKIAIATGK